MFITMNTFICFVIVCLTFGGTNGSSAPRWKRSFGGEEAPVDLYPYQASLRQESKHFCNGAIVSKRCIVTAAQCLYGFTENPFIYTVAVGSVRLDEPNTIYDAIEVIMHPGYNIHLHMHDIALVCVSKNIEFNEKVQPVALPETERNYDNYPLVVTGWANYMNLHPYRLQEIIVKGYPQEWCKNHYNFLVDSQMCTQCQKRGEGLCDGDFGDPVVADGVLVGLVSLVRCSAAYPDVSTRIFNYRFWIKENAKEF